MREEKNWKNQLIDIHNHILSEIDDGCWIFLCAREYSGWTNLRLILYVYAYNITIKVGKGTITNTFLKTVSAFSNYNGGTILFGVDNDGNVKGLSCNSNS